MNADDPRHGTEAGHVAHRRAGLTVCEPCRRARMRAQKARRLTGVQSKVPAIGSRRRIQALQALGWSRLTIARQLGYADNGAISYLMTADTMLAVTAVRIAEVYDRLSMIRPDSPGAARARTWAVRQGYAPPLAWECIDTDAAPNYGSADIDVDPVVIDRICSGDWRLSANLAERIAVLERWQAAGLADNEVERRTGWNVARDIRPHLRSKDAA